MSALGDLNTDFVAGSNGESPPRFSGRSLCSGDAAGEAPLDAGIEASLAIAREALRALPAELPRELAAPGS